MRRIALAAALLVLAAGAVVLGGCSAATTKMDTSKVWGYVASADKTQLDVATDQRGVDTLVVKKVVAPTDAWVVVHADVDGAPGMRVGLTHVKRGETADVKVALKDLTTPNVIVALHADKGTPGKFDFDMMKKEASPDRPYFVDRKELARVVALP